MSTTRVVVLVGGEADGKTVFINYKGQPVIYITKRMHVSGISDYESSKPIRRKPPAEVFYLKEDGQYHYDRTVVY